MRCTGFRLEDRPLWLQQEICYVKIPAQDAVQLTPGVTGLIQRAQGRGLVQRAEGDHSFYQISRPDLTTALRTDPAAQMIRRTGATIAGALPDGRCHGGRVHLYVGEGAGMAPHQDSNLGSAHPFPCPIHGALVLARAIKLAWWSL